MGGHLASIKSREELQFIQQQICGQPAWIGAVRHGSGNGPGAANWRWSDGTQWEFTNWAGGEPNNAGGREDRVQMYGQHDGKWNDIHSGWSGPGM